MNVGLYLVHALSSDGTVLDDDGLNYGYAASEYGTQGALDAANEHFNWLVQGGLDAEIVTVSA